MSAISRLSKRVRAQLDLAWFEVSSQSVLVACSGGGDSVALLHVAVDIFGARFVHCVSVNHNLRPEAETEAMFVARTCADLGVSHEVCDWHWDGQGNLQAAARQGRRDLLSQAAETHNCGLIWLGHTRDDQAETVLMRLARGSGVDGLAGMALRDDRVERPLLDISRKELRDALREDGIGWMEDPSNQDIRFDRVRARKLLQELGNLGLSQERLLKTARMMQAEAEVLAHAATDWAKTNVTDRGGDLLIGVEAMQSAPSALVERVVARAIQWFSGAPYKPRHDALQRWMAQSLGGQRSTLSGVLATREPDHLRLSREVSACGHLEVNLGAIAEVIGWDHRWCISPPKGAERAFTIQALGEDIAQIPDWRTVNLPRGSLMATPAIWHGNTLIAAPVAQPDGPWRSRLSPCFTTFLESR